MSELRPRTVWDVLDDAFDLYRERFTLFAGIAAAALVPGYLPFLYWMRDVAVATSGAPGGDPADLLGTLFRGAGSSYLILGIAYTLFLGATAAAVDDHLAGRSTGLAAAYRRALPRSLSLLGAALLVSLLAGVTALLTFGVGAIVVSVFYAFVPQTVVLEASGAIRAGRRSRELVQGNGGKVFGLFLLLGLLSGFLLMGIGGVAQLLLPLAPGPGDVAARQLRDMLIGQGIQTILSVLLAPLTPIALTLLYYDVRVRREGLDMEAQAAAIGYLLVADPFGGVPSEVARRVAAQQAARAAHLAARQGPPSPGGP